MMTHRIYTNERPNKLNVPTRMSNEESNDLINQTETAEDSTARSSDTDIPDEPNNCTRQYMTVLGDYEKKYTGNLTDELLTCPIKVCRRHNLFFFCSHLYFRI